MAPPFYEEAMMAQSGGRRTVQSGDPIADPISAWTTTLVQGCLQMQQLQWKVLATWQQSFATLGKDFWEQWACRYAGGVPIDA